MLRTNGASPIEDASPRQSLRDLARSCLSERLKTVRRLLRDAGSRARGSEQIHQLRVGTRRSIAALRILAQVLPRRRVAKLSRMLKRIRRTASRARDLDVMLARLTARDAASERPEPRALLGLLRTLRDEAQRPLARLCAKRLPRRLRRQTVLVLDRIRWRGPGSEPSLEFAARSAVQQALAPILSIQREALAQANVLHRLRIRVKHLRYATEVFGDTFPPEALRRTLGLVCEIQDRLGEINDHASAVTMAHELRPRIRSRSARRELRAWCEASRADLQAAIQRFQEWWQVDLPRQIERALGLAADPLEPAESRAATGQPRGDPPSLLPNVTGP